MDEAVVRRARAVAQQSLTDMPPSGVVGFAAFASCGRLLDLIEKLDAGNAAASLDQAKEISQTLDQVSAAFKKGLHADSLETALARFATVAEGLVRQLEGAKGSSK